MRATIQTHGRSTWAYGALPVHAVKRAFRIDGQQATWPVVPVKAQGDQSMICAVQTPATEEPMIFGEFVGGEPTIKPPDSFQLDPWVGDEPMKLLPHLWIDELEETEPKISLVRSTKVDQVFLIHQRVEGYVMKLWVRFKHLDPAADVCGYVAWSDRKSPDLDRTEYLVLGFGELFWPAWKGHLGGEPWYAKDKWWVPLQGEKWIDGSSVPIRGTLMCGPASLAEGDDIHAKLVNLLKSQSGPQWFSIQWPHTHHWLAHQNVPVMDRQAAMQQSGFEQGSWLGLMETPGGSLYEPRPLGLQPDAGRTGDQEAFGSTKGTWALAGQPWWIDQALWSVTGHGLRGFQHFEADGSRVLAENHPDWRTWSGRTFPPRGSDLLGKKAAGWGDLRNTGWSGMDDQHRSTINACAVLALTGDEYVEDLLEHLVETDNAMVEGRLGAPRAIGRLFLDWANMDRVLTGKAKRDTVANFKKKQQIVIEHGRGLQHDNPVRVLSWGRDPRYGIFDAEGNSLPCWVVWEHALCLIGLYAAHKRFRLDPKARDLMEGIADTITRYGTFLENVEGQDVWHYCATVHYPGLDTPEEGQPIDPSLYHRKSDRITWQLGGTGTWTLRGLMIAREILTGDVQTRANEIVRQKVGWSPPSDRRSAEWDACTRMWTPLS